MKLDDLLFALTRSNWAISRRCVLEFSALLRSIEDGGFKEERLLDWLAERYPFANGKDDARSYRDGVLRRVLEPDAAGVLRLNAAGRAFLLAEKVLGRGPLAAVLRSASRRGPFSMFMLNPKQYLWSRKNGGELRFLRDSLQADVREFIRKEVPRFHGSYPAVDAFMLFSGGPDSLLAALTFARRNPDKKVVLATFSGRFHSCNWPVFLSYYKTLLAPEKNILGIEALDFTDLFESLNSRFKDRYASRKLRPCITCKLLMAYLLDILLESYGGAGEKLILSGYRGPERGTLFPQTKRFDAYAKRVLRHARHEAPIWDHFDQRDVYAGIEKMGVRGYDREKGIECSGPLTWDEQGFRYGRHDFELLEDVVGLLNSLDRTLL
ncbi:MAG: hypothetical protein WC728_07980 [Elusimicrobiota bacterium]